MAVLRNMRYLLCWRQTGQLPLSSVLSLNTPHHPSRAQSVMFKPRLGPHRGVHRGALCTLVLSLKPSEQQQGWKPFPLNLLRG